MTRLADFVPKPKESTAIRLEDLAGKEVMVVDFRVVEGKFGEFAFVDVMDEAGKVYTFISGARLILAALKAAREENALPCPAVFQKNGRYWTVR